MSLFNKEMGGCVFTLAEQMSLLLQTPGHAPHITVWSVGRAPEGGKLEFPRPRAQRAGHEGRRAAPPTAHPPFQRRCLPPGTERSRTGGLPGLTAEMLQRCLRYIPRAFPSDLAWQQCAQRGPAPHVPKHLTSTNASPLPTRRCRRWLDRDPPCFPDL